ncbi:filaggrin-2-like [Hipposideros larvatus]
MHMLDKDHDRRLDFTEFLLMVFKLAMACNKVLSKEYCKASGSKQQKRGHGHRHPDKGDETEEDDEDTPGQKSGYRYSSWSEGEDDGQGWRGTTKHRRGSSSRRLERHGELSSGGSEEGFETRRRGSSHSWSSGKERHGSSSGELEGKRNKSYVSLSRESGEDSESGSGSMRGLVQVNFLKMVNMGLVQVKPQAFNSTVLIQVRPLAMANKGQARVSPLVLDNTGLAPVIPLALVNMNLARVSLLAMANKGLAQVSPLA